MICSKRFTKAIALLMPSLLYSLLPLSSSAGPGNSLSEQPFRPSQFATLNSLDMPVWAPTNTLGFELTSVHTSVSKSRIGGKSSLQIYERVGVSGDRFCFGIETTNGGIGGIPTGTDTYLFTHPIFGKSSIEYGKYGLATQNSYLGNWIGTDAGPFIRFVGANILPETQGCQNIRGADAIRVSESISRVN